MTLTKSKLTTSMGYLKYSSRSKALQVARKLDLAGSHKHVMQGTTIYMPGSNHGDLNDALRERGLPETMMPGQGMMGMAPGDDLDEAMMPDMSMAGMGMGMTTGMDRPMDGPTGDLPDQPTVNYTADELDQLMTPDFEEQVDDQLEGGLIDEEFTNSMGLGVGDRDEDDDMEIY